ncbi:MAG: hypothetical protein J5885_01185 [Clostridia bacterium]|nr:hypothetical protein [Clostridia bacterium]
MFVIRLAGLRVRMENRYPFVERQCREYLAEGDEADFSVSVSEEEIREEQRNGDFSAGYCESICLYRHICEVMPSYGVFIMHSAVVEVDGRAYAFTAKSGVGKSTHLSLWLKNIPHARVLNGDKPLYRAEDDGTVTVYGTPWNGKENWGYNGSAPLAAVCFIERGQTNAIRRATEDETIARLMHQLYLRGSREAVNRQLMLMNELVKAVPYYILSCTVSDEAAWLSYKTMSRV